jgi:glycosyltransferase involved in cell wall biosynthesis
MLSVEPDPAAPQIPVSIVIPNYNRQDLVGETIRSALDQGPEFEVIVVDDGSPDDSWSVIQGFGDRIRAVRQENSGLGETRNVGLRMARGRFVRFLDCDDRMPPGSLRAQLAEAERLPPRHIAVGDAASIDENGHPVPPQGYGFAGQAPAGPLDRATVLRYIVNAWLPLFPAEALRETGGFATDMNGLEDHELAMRLLRAGYRFERVPVTVCEVREHSGYRMSRNIGVAGYRRLQNLYGRLWQDFESDWSGKLTPEERGALGQLVWTVARDAVRFGFVAEARDLFELAQRIGGSRARTGRLPVRLAYRLLPPLAAERLFMAAKKLARRSG